MLDTLRQVVVRDVAGVEDLGLLPEAGGLQVKHGMSTWDGVHLATAIVAKVDVLVVRDGKLRTGSYEGVYVTGPFDIDDDKLPVL